MSCDFDAVVSSGLKEAGYNFINIDDGFWGDRDAQGNIIPHPTRFPTGMKTYPLTFLLMMLWCCE